MMKTTNRTDAEAVERERERELLFYSTWNLSTRPHTQMF